MWKSESVLTIEMMCEVPAEVMCLGASTIRIVHISGVCLPLRYCSELMSTSHAMELVPYVVDVLWSMLTIEILSESPIEIDSQCASTIRNVHIPEYADH
jgi:hypothetical protein